MKIRIGTRGSDLALWQARWVSSELTKAGCDVELDVMKTRGDRIDDVPLQNIEGKAFFTAEIESALLERRVDVAVHSHKDLPVASSPGLCVAAVAPRASSAERLLVAPDAFDADGTFLPLKLGARIGTSSPRRQAQVRALRPDVEVLHLRGNVPTRVNRLREGRYDAILLAAAGLDRLELDTSDLRVVDLPLELVVPAPGQGALAIQVREGDESLRELVRRILHDEETALCVNAERRLLELAGGGCNLALGAALVRLDVKGSERWCAHVFRGADATDTERAPRWARALDSDPVKATELAFHRAEGTAATDAGPLGGISVALTGGTILESPLAERLLSLGAHVVAETVIRCESLDMRPGAARVELAPHVAALRSGDALAVTSQHAVQHLAGVEIPDGVVVAAVGRSTARELAAVGIEVGLVGKGGARELGSLLTLEPGARVLHPCAQDALFELQGALDPRGVEVKRVEVYRTVPEPEIDLTSGVDVRVYMSPSAVKACLSWERAGSHERTTRVALGESTAKALFDAELTAIRPSAEGGLSEGIVRVLREQLSKREE